MRLKTLILAVALFIGGSAWAQSPSGGYGPSSSSSTVSPSGSIAGTQSFNYIDPTNSLYGVKADVRVARDAAFSFTNGQTTITCATCGWTSALLDGKTFVEATSWSGAGTSYASVTNLFPFGLITAFNSGTNTITVATTASASTTGTGVLLWGHDDTAAWNLVYTAIAMGNQCLVAQLSGHSFVRSQLFNTTPTCNTGWSSNNSRYVGIRGGESSALEFIPTTDFTITCPGGGGNLMFFGAAGITVENVIIQGYGANPGGASACSITGNTIDSTFLNIVVAGWLANTTGVIGFNFGSSIAAGGHMIQNISVEGVSRPCVVTGNARNAIDNFCATTSANPALEVIGGALWEGQTDAFEVDGGTSTAMVKVNANGAFTESMGQFVEANVIQSSFVSSACNSRVSLNHMAPMINTTHVNSDIWAGPAACGATPAELYLFDNQTIQGGSPGGAFFLTDTGNKVYDLGGNGIVAPIFGTGLGSISQIFGDASITGTAAVATNVTPSTGWGTTGAAGNGVTATSGGTKHMRFTITATGTPGANPTITVTFPLTAGTKFASGFFVVPICTIRQVGGTGAQPTQPFDVPSPTVTGTGAITWTGTPVAASTYIFDLACGSSNQ